MSCRIPIVERAIIAARSARTRSRYVCTTPPATARPRRRGIQPCCVHRRARLGDRRALLAEQVEIDSQIGLRGAGKPDRAGIGRWDDIAAREPRDLRINVRAHLRPGPGTLAGEHRLRLANARQPDVERRIAGECIGDDPVKLRVAERVPPIGGDRRRIGCGGQPQRRAGHLVDLGMRGWDCAAGQQRSGGDRERN